MRPFFRRARVCSAALSAVALAACNPAEEPVANASSEVAAVRPGSSIVVPGTAEVVPGVDTASEYAAARRIETLKKVAWMTADELAVVTRADGMLSSAPRDGNISVDELAQLAAPSHAVVLSPGEKAALKTVWRFMRAPRARELPAMELWANGEPTSRIHAPPSPTLPETSSHPKVSMTRFFGYAFFSGETRLDERNVVAEEPFTSQTYRYSDRVQPPIVFDDGYTRNRLNPERNHPLPRGRYDSDLSADGRTMRVDVYPEGAVLVSFGQATAGLAARELLPALPDRAGRRVAKKDGVTVTIFGDTAEGRSGWVTYRDGTTTTVTLPLDERTRTGW